MRIYDRALSKEEINELYNLEKPKSPLDKGPVAYYPFNGNAKDESGNGNHGRVEGATGVVDRHGKEVSAYSFDGDGDYIAVKDDPTISGLPAMTVSVWVNWDTLKDMGQQDIIYKMSPFSGGEHIFQLMPAGEKIRTVIQGSGQAFREQKVSFTCLLYTSDAADE